jgi:hypothetical protein
MGFMAPVVRSTAVIPGLVLSWIGESFSFGHIMKLVNMICDCCVYWWNLLCQLSGADECNPQAYFLCVFFF